MFAPDRRADLRSLGREIGLHLGDSGFDRLAPAQHGGLLAGGFICQCGGGGPIGGFLRHAGGPGQDAAIRPDEDLRQIDALIAQHKLPRLIGMLHAARLDDRQRAGALSRLLQIAQHHPGVDQR